MLKTKNLFDLDHTLAKDMLLSCEYPWQALPKIGAAILAIGAKLGDDYDKRGENIWIHKSVKVYPTADITGPCIIGADTEVRPGAFIRGNALVGENCVVGNSTELKNVILFDHVQVPHYNYVGDSILGYYAHMGAGSITSNVKSDKKLVKVHAHPDIETGLKKFGAMIGDRTEIGCGSVLNPGSVIGPDCIIYPLSSVRGVVKPNHIYKNKEEVIIRKLEEN